jgi:phage terminase Nu1 subunit (DNA packaging protein)
VGEVIQFTGKRVGDLVLSKHQLAQWRGCTTKTIERHMTEGLPHFHGSNERSLFRFSQATDWYAERDRRGG